MQRSCRSCLMLLCVSILLMRPLPVTGPSIWKAFLADERGPRVLQGVLCSRTLSLRAATDNVRLAQESMDKARFKLEDLQRDQKKKAEREKKKKIKISSSFILLQRKLSD